MTLLMGASLLLIVASTAALTVGWLDASRSLIVGSIGGLAAASVLLVLAYVRRRSIVAGGAIRRVPQGVVGVGATPRIPRAMPPPPPPLPARRVPPPPPPP